MERALWAIVRIDHFLEDLPNLTDPLTLVTVTRIYEDEGVAAREVARLSSLRDDGGNEYFTVKTELDNEAPGREPVVVVGVQGYVVGSRMEPSMVRLGGVFPSRDLAVVPPSDATVWGLFTARLGPRKN